MAAKLKKVGAVTVEGHNILHTTAAEDDRITIKTLALQSIFKGAQYSFGLGAGANEHVSSLAPQM